MKKNYFFGTRKGIILTGCIIGLLSAVLQRMGNPPGAGLCISCFERDLVGALGFHRVEGGQYLRPEIIGLIWGSTLAAVIFREFKSRSGSAPLIRFGLGVVAMIGALSFMGCPFGMVLRLASGNLNAILAVAGLSLGIYIGVLFMRAGFDLGRSQTIPPISGWLIPIAAIGLFLMRVFSIRVDDLSAPFWSWVEPSSLFAPPFAALAIGVLIGFLAQRSRFCTIGAVRDLILMRNNHYLWGIIAMLVTAFAGNLLFGQIRVNYLAAGSDNSVSVIQYVWSILAAVLSGLSFTLVGGCAGRQLFLAGEGDGDAGIFVLGMLAGAAITHNFSLVGRPACGTIGDIQTLGAVAIILGLIFCLAVGFTMRNRWEGLP
jgi:YedE family putative selenium metabolism protein